MMSPISIFSLYCNLTNRKEGEGAKGVPRKKNIFLVYSEHEIGAAGHTLFQRFIISANLSFCTHLQFL